MPCDPRAGKASADLVAELFSAQSAITPFDGALLERAGVPRFLIDDGMIAAGSITVRSDGTYDLDPDGARAYITPCRVGDPSTPEAIGFEVVPQFGNLVDLVAWHPRRPHRWALRRGAGSWLGAIPPQLCDPPPVPIRRSPMSWLRAGATGLCPLDHDALGIWRVLNVCRSLQAEDPNHARELRRALERPFPIPPITVPAARRRVGANHA